MLTKWIFQADRVPENHFTSGPGRIHRNHHLNCVCIMMKNEKNKRATIRHNANNWCMTCGQKGKALLSMGYVPVILSLRSFHLHSGQAHASEPLRHAALTAPAPTDSRCQAAERRACRIGSHLSGFFGVVSRFSQRCLSQIPSHHEPFARNAANGVHQPIAFAFQLSAPAF